MSRARVRVVRALRLRGGGRRPAHRGLPARTPPTSATLRDAGRDARCSTSCEDVRVRGAGGRDACAAALQAAGIEESRIEIVDYGSLLARPDRAGRRRGARVAGVRRAGVRALPSGLAALRGGGGGGGRAARRHRAGRRAGPRSASASRRPSRCPISARTSRSGGPCATDRPVRQERGVACDPTVMEAATPLPFAHVRVRNGRLLVDQLVVDDETTVRLATEREDPARFVLEAIEIGARVLDRELTGANAEFVRAEFEQDRPRARHRVRRPRTPGRRPARPEGRRGLRTGERPRQQGAGQALRRRVLCRRAEPRQGGGRRGDRPDARGPAQAVLRRQRQQPAGRLPAGDARGPQADRRPAGRRSCGRWARSSSR